MQGLKLFHIPNTPLVILLENYYFDYNEETLKIPAGFAFDGASVPTAFRGLGCPFQYPYIELGLRHDWLYSERSGEQDKDDVDIKFYDDLVKEGKTIKAGFFYVGVDWFGGISWKKDRNYKKYKSIIVEYRDKLGLLENKIEKLKENHILN